MAWTRTLPSGKYQGLYRDGAGKVRTVADGPFTHKRAAERAASAAELESRSLGWRSPDAGRRTWGEWCAEWWPTRTVEASTLKTDAGRRDLHLMPRWGDVELASITRHDIKAWAAELQTRRSTGTVQRVVHLLSASLVAAVDAEILQANPAARLKLGGGTASVERYVTRDEFSAVLDHLDEPYAQMAILLAWTGMRWSEAAGLHWARVDERRGVVEIAEVWDADASAMKPYPKGRQRRHVPLPGWIDLGERRAGVCGYEHLGPACRSGLVLTTARGAHLDHSKFSKAWGSAVAAAGVGHVRPHDLRHTYASWLIQDGVSLAEVGRLLGHVSPLTTQRYAHLADVPSERVLQALGGDPRGAARAAEVQQSESKPRLTLLNGGAAGA
ncbi:tyrosine-type recombinase/integrase [Oerskovia paurometabola]|uniref:Tyrosine-type recombinase/integrase n=1 Tax=Oerskovia paurometabola TaxID=162170 RepID=A0ABW1X911_9CELL|nr:site-specific integrase [Oerskovia paurometabola]MBM7497771.1 integrase [Oerskovia paurometabola]